MKELYDQKLVRRLAAAVREHIPDDWLASRSMRRALLWQKAVQGLLIFCGLWMLTLFPNLPVIELGKAKTELPGAYGLSALLLVSGAADWANPIWLVALPALLASELCVRWLLRSLGRFTTRVATGKCRADVFGAKASPITRQSSPNYPSGLEAFEDMAGRIVGRPRV